MTQPYLDRASTARRPTKRGKWIALLALVVLAGGFIVWYWTAKPSTPTSAPAEKPAVALQTNYNAPRVLAQLSRPIAPTNPIAPPVVLPTRPIVAPPPPPAIPRPTMIATTPTSSVVTTTTIAKPPITVGAAPAPLRTNLAAMPTPTVVPASTIRVIAPTSTPAVVPTVAPTPTEDRRPLDQAKAHVAAEKFGDARDALEKFLATSRDAALRKEAEDLLGSVNLTLIYSPRPMREKSDYTVRPGDSLDKLARKFSTSVGLIQKSNQLKSPMIRVDQRLRIFSGSFRVRVDKTDNTLTLFLNDTFFKRYSVGTGEYSKTPTGTFKVVDRIAQPTWWKDGKSIPYGDPANLLGTHWLALDVKGYGIHGTWEPDSIGKQSSAGCVRLLNNEVEQLFDLLPIGTSVTIQE